MPIGNTVSTEVKRYKGRDVDTDIKDQRGKRKSVLTLLSEYEEAIHPHIQRHYPMVERNEAYYAGQQTEDDDPETPRTASYRVDLPTVSNNFLTNLGLSWVSRMAKPRQRVKAWPADPSFSDEAAAKMANAFIDYQYQVQDIDNLVTDLCEAAFIGGCAAISPTWDPTRGKHMKIPVLDDFDMPMIDEFGEEMMEDGGPMGDVYWRMLTVFDYWIDPVENTSDARWVVFRKIVAKDEIGSLLEQSNIKGKKVDLDRVDTAETSNVFGIKQEGVEVFEMWQRPEPGVTEGFMATIVGGNVVQMLDFPYEHGELPICVFKVRKVRNYAYGLSPCFDVVDLQEQHNGYSTNAARLQKRLMNAAKLLCSPDIATAITEDEEEIIPVVDQNNVGAARWLTGPFEIISHLLDYADKVKGQGYEVAGLNEELTGAETAKSGRSAKMIAYMQELDSQKLIVAARNLDNTLVRAWRQTLRLGQQYVKAERFLSIVGPAGQVDTQSFLGADIQGVDVRLEPIGGEGMTRAGQAAQAQEDAQAGLITPEQAAEIGESGLQFGQDGMLDVSVVRQQIDQVLAGQMVDPDPQVDIEIAIDEIGLARDVAIRNGEQMAAVMLNQLMMAYRMRPSPQQMQQQAPQQQQGMMPPPMPGGPQGVIPG